VINQIDDGLSGRRSENRAFDQELTKLEIRLAEERSQLGFIQSSAQDEYQIDLSQVDWKSELWEGNVEFEKRVNLDDMDDPDKLAAQPKHERRDPLKKNLRRWTAPTGPRSKKKLANSKAASPTWGPSTSMRSVNTPT
jgi:hypothetical protein